MAVTEVTEGPTLGEANAAEALFRRLTCPPGKRRKLIDAYRDEILRGAAGRLRSQASVMHHISSRELLERAAEDIEPDGEETT